MMAQDTRLSEQATNVKFVYEVKKHPCLYNPDLMTYSRKDITDRAWNDVGKVMNMNGSACKEKWRNLRIVFMRHMKSSQYSGTGRRKRRYYLSDAMQFLLPFIKVSPPAPPKSVTPEEAQEKEKTFYDAYRFTKDERPDNTILEAFNVPVVKIETDDDQSNDTNQDAEGHSKRMSVHESDHYNFSTDAERIDQSVTGFVIDSNDPIRSFLNSLVPELEEMNSSQFKSFKRRVLALIDDITDNDITENIKNVAKQS